MGTVNMYLSMDSEESKSILESDNWMAHLSHMTSEDLRSKSRIAVELTRRDIEIDRLTCTNKSLTQYLHIQRDALDAYTESPLGKRVAELESENRALKEISRINEAVIQGKSEPLEFNDYPPNK